MYAVEKECVDRFRLTSRSGDIAFSIGTDIPKKTSRFGRLLLDLEQKRILFCPNREGMDDRVVMFYRNGDDYVPKGDTELTQLYKKIQEVLAKPRWAVTAHGIFDYSYIRHGCRKKR